MLNSGWALQSGEETYFKGFHLQSANDNVAVDWQMAIDRLAPKFGRAVPLFACFALLSHLSQNGLHLRS